MITPYHGECIRHQFKLKEHLTNLGLGYGSKYYQGKTQACYIGVKQKEQPRDDDDDGL